MRRGPWNVDERWNSGLWGGGGRGGEEGLGLKKTSLRAGSLVPRTGEARKSVGKAPFFSPALGRGSPSKQVSLLAG